MENHEIENEIAVADKAINRKDFDALTDCYTDESGKWRCAIDNSYGAELLDHPS